MYFDVFYNFSSNISYYGDIMRYITTNYLQLHVRYPLFLSDFNDTWIFAIDFRKNTQI
jgi:hypothetical protein